MTQDSPKRRPAALVFGGSRGIGAAAVTRLAAEGYAVAFTYVSREDSAQALVRSIEDQGGQALALQADSADAQALAQAVTRTVAQLGPLSVVVVNAGLLRLGTIDQVSVQDLDQMLAVNVRGVFLSIQACVPHLVEQASVITIGSNVAVRSGHPGGSVYQMTKTAVAGLVKGLALDLAPRGIRVNNVQPGPVDTDMTHGMLSMLVERSPLKRVGTPAEVAGLIAYLASHEARYLTGASLTLDGGYSL